MQTLHSYLKNDPSAFKNFKKEYVTASLQDKIRLLKDLCICERDIQRMVPDALVDNPATVIPFGPDTITLKDPATVIPFGPDTITLKDPATITIVESYSVN